MSGGPLNSTSSPEVGRHSHHEVVVDIKKRLQGFFVRDQLCKKPESNRSNAVIALPQIIRNRPINRQGGLLPVARRRTLCGAEWAVIERQGSAHTEEEKAETVRQRQTATLSAAKL